MRKKSGKRSGFVKLFPPLAMLSKCIDVGRSAPQPNHHAGGYSAPYKAAHRLFVYPTSFHFHSRGSEPESCLWCCTLPHSAVQRYPAIVHLSKRSVVLVWSSSAGHT